VIRYGALKTMEEVLEDLKDKNWRSIMDDVKTKVISDLRSVISFSYTSTKDSRVMSPGSVPTANGRP
jgi:hypothetical protein